MRTSKPEYFDPEVISLLWNRDREAEEHRRAVRIWTWVAVLFVVCAIWEAVR
jgi:hypothetical protein